MTLSMPSTWQRKHLLTGLFVFNDGESQEKLFGRENIAEASY